MNCYEIRLCNWEHPAPAIVRARQASDFAAIRKARAIARKGDSIEVWKGAECIYADSRQGLSLLH